MTQFPFTSNRLAQNRVFVHLLFWLGYLIFFALINSGGGEFGESLFYESIMLPTKLLVVYLTLYVLIPRFLLEKRYWQMALLLIALLGVAGIIQRTIVYYVVYPIQYQDIAFGYGPYWATDKLFKHIIQISFVLVVASAVKIQKYYYRFDQASKALERE
ncbi:MAG: hypothetical protein AAF927_22575, partial [Bacteroidota bacterium]